LVVTPSAGLEFLPRDRARAKLARLVEGARAFEGRG
jgi:methionine synthase II (cobalamin-independent)